MKELREAIYNEITRIESNNKQEPETYKIIKGIVFIPLVIESFYAEINITMLVPGQEWMPVFSRGDIDNKVKTLLDALRVPQNENELPTNINPEPNPFYCLLMDDRLISKVSIEKRRIWFPSRGNKVKLVIDVKIKEHTNRIYNFRYPSFLKD